MSTVAMSGDDTLILNNRILTDFADQDCAVLTFPNKIAAAKTGKNGNTIYSMNQMGKQAELSMRIIRASADDKFLNNLLSQQQGNFSGFPLLIGSFIKNIGDGQGNVAKDTYQTSGGIFLEIPMAKTNTEGQEEQSVAIYKLLFSLAPRVIR